jgi:hypothetical protein
MAGCDSWAAAKGCDEVAPGVGAEEVMGLADCAEPPISSYGGKA